MPDDVLLIADGTHFGTLLGFARERADGGRPVDTIFVTRPPERPAGAVTAGEQDAVLADRFAALSRSMRAVPLGELEAALEEAPPHAVAAGASNAAMAIVQRVAERRGVAGRAALQTAMPCGLGACQGCIFPRRGGGWLRVCDGPVFPLSEPEFAA
jgi:dihydroorotate dehydrogenase electron transfer subunit